MPRTLEHSLLAGDNTQDKRNSSKYVKKLALSLHYSMVVVVQSVVVEVLLRQLSIHSHRVLYMAACV